ncbi:hypothetical protein T4B_10469 [Trichinella pseudospiralis]|uniref:Uncharacterized protein n=1 Tax=Trichinella pseudospiralis TaxID=6337 RepID=A0A0V1GPA3_TRIPS|nr:hypothetical protein T4B_10469 [Trichinella pseudospiralis]
MEEIERAGHEIQAYVQRTSAACGLICDMLSAYCLPDRGAAIFNAGFCYVTNRERSYKPCLCQADSEGTTDSHQRAEWYFTVIVTHP